MNSLWVLGGGGPSDDCITIVAGPDAALQYDRRVKINTGNPMTGHVVEAVLSFWFVEGSVPGLCEYRPIWIASSPEFDAAIETRFSDTFERAAAEELDNLATTPEGALALIIILDQFPRNLFRNSPRAFATDAKARTLCHQAVARGADKKLTGIQRIFCYLPLQHSEEIEDQERSVELFGSLGDEKVFHFIQEAARRHLDIIERFDRFPHRNECLGRASTPAERAFLESAEGRFWTH
jgi:uncharacterized protein (DUF924 family)